MAEDVIIKDSIRRRGEEKAFEEFINVVVRLGLKYADKILPETMIDKASA